MKNQPEIVIAGAGSIGCFVGGVLLDAGHNVTFLGRKRIAKELKHNGLTLTDYTGLNLKVAPEKIRIEEKPEVLSGKDIILVCTKSAATQEMAGLIETHASKKSVSVSLQNGLRNADLLKELIPNHDVRAGMVAFNVIHGENGSFHRGTSGGVVIEKGQPDIASLLTNTAISIESSDQMKAVQWGKLLMNLNNAVNALSGMPLREQLADRTWRKTMAAQVSEGLKVMKAAGIDPKPPTPAPAWVIPHVLRLPNALFQIAAKQMLEIDPKARSSMAEDVAMGRKTEIDEFQGEIIRLGEKYAVPTPVSSDIHDRIREIEANM